MYLLFLCLEILFFISLREGSDESVQNAAVPLVSRGEEKRFPSLLNDKMARIYCFVVLLLAVLMCSQNVWAQRTHKHRRDDSHWVDIWASMPQLTEPANLPPVPFVRPLNQNIKQQVSLIVKSNTLSRTQRQPSLPIPPSVKPSISPFPQPLSVFASPTPLDLRISPSPL